MTFSKTRKKSVKNSAVNPLKKKRRFRGKPKKISKEEDKRQRSSLEQSTSTRTGSSDPGKEFADHLSKHILCDKCHISHLTSRKVFYRGSFQADVLLIGEAPGESEDACGIPFIGRSGKLLDQMLQEAGYPPGSYGITNTVLCTPFKDESRDEIRAPTKDEIKNCSKRLHDVTKRVKPKVIVAVGKKAEQALKLLKIPFTPIRHPAFILRQGGAKSSVEYKRNVIILKKILELVNETKTSPKTKTNRSTKTKEIGQTAKQLGIVRI